MRGTSKTIARVALVALLAVALLLPAGCGSRTAKGAGIGAAVGAVTGAVVGNQSGHAKEGAVIGAVAGGALGAVVGARMDRQAEELAKVAETKRTEQGVIVTLSSNKIHFDVDQAVVKDDSRATLVELANILKNYPEDIIVVAGHTDSDGSEAYNMDLSKRRAQAVVDILAANGVPSESIQAHGYGEAQPVASNETAEPALANDGEWTNAARGAACDAVSDITPSSCLIRCEPGAPSTRRSPKNGTRGSPAVSTCEENTAPRTSGQAALTKSSQAALSSCQYHADTPPASVSTSATSSSMNA